MMKLLAPNGKPSNLTPEQYALVRTPEFKAWFGDWESAYETVNYDNVSKVIDEETKEPLVVRHFSQSNKRHTVFKEKAKKHEWSVSQKGIYFTSLNAKELNDAYNRTGKGILYEVFLNIRNLLDLGIYDTYDFINEKPVFWKNHHFEMLDKYVTKGRIGQFDNYTEFEANVDYTTIQDISEKSKNKILKLGYNGIWGNKSNDIYDTIDEIVVFYPNQIKLADGTNTTFDNNPDIRYNNGGNVLPKNELIRKMYGWYSSFKDRYYKDLKSAHKDIERVVDFNNKQFGTIFGNDNSKDIINLFDFIETKKGIIVEPKIKQSVSNKKIEYITDSDLVNKEKQIWEYGHGIEIGRYFSKLQYIDTDDSRIYGTEKPKEEKIIKLMNKLKNGDELPPILLDYDFGILDGHHRYEASKRLGIKQIPIIIYEYPDEKYANGGEVLLAPNGKPSNLTPEQYRLVRTPAFKKWFGDWENDAENSSKVVDSNGEPLVVYHGGQTKFNIFSPYSQGHYFTDNIKYAKAFTEKSDDGHLFKCFINVRNYLDARKLSELTPSFEINEKELIIFFKKNGIYSKEMEKSIKDFFKKQCLKKTFWSYLRNYGFVIPSSYKEIYDAIFLNEHSLNGTKINVYFVHESNQIKLADGTNTTFDSNNPDIRYAEGGSIEEVKNYLKNIRVDKDYMESESDLSIVQYQSDFGRKGTLVWRAYPEWGKDGLSEDVKGSIYISSISRGTGGDSYSFVSSIEGKKDSRGEGAMALASLFLRYPLVHSVHYEDESGFEDELGYYKISFWQKIGGDESELMREDFFNYFTKKFGYNPDTKTQHLLERYKLLEELAEEIKEKPKNLSYYKRLVALKEKRKKYIESINPDIKFKNGGLTIKKPKAKLLAPNGKPSNLTPEQYKLVRTPAFKAWFGDWENSPETASKVVDKNGEPLVVLHGSNNKFNIFKKSKNKSYANNVFGFYFATNEWIAKNYGKYINYYFLNIRSIIKLNEMDFQIHLNYSSWDNNLKTLNEYKKKKIDGIFYIPTIYVAFEPTQIKLADGTNTTFDSNNPDIRYAEGGSIPDLLSSQEVEYKLGRKLDWWNDDIVYLSGTEYKKVYLRPEYKKVIE
jgi:hypothetical protein